ncbi:HD domain-containing protein [Nocardia sp. NPDC049149]|uniref:HD domain-containing protein n=1 Tax=Nocardia sp. NPDC049149 TaxID=3364315 RepID=UPI00371434C1
MTVATTPLLTLPALPDTRVANQCLALAVLEESRAIANHSIRSYLFARLFADHIQAKPGDDYDQELLFIACVLHDIGLGRSASTQVRFEVESAEMAALFLTERAVPAADVDAVWQAIALHTSPHIAEHRNTLCYLTRSGINLDFGPPSEFISDAQGAAIHEAYPRHSMVTSLVNAVVGQADAYPDKAPPFSAAAVLLNERQLAPDHMTWMERATTTHGRWGN